MRINPSCFSMCSLSHNAPVPPSLPTSWGCFLLNTATCETALTSETANCIGQTWKETRVGFFSPIYNYNNPDNNTTRVFILVWNPWIGKQLKTTIATDNSVLSHEVNRGKEGICSLTHLEQQQVTVCMKQDTKIESSLQKWQVTAQPPTLGVGEGQPNPFFCTVFISFPLLDERHLQSLF